MKISIFSFLLLTSKISNNVAGLAVGSHVIKKVVSITQRRPEMVAVVLTGLKTGASDIIAQKLDARRSKDVKKKLDKRRVITFLLYGGIYLGWFQHFLFAKVYCKLFPLAQVFASQSTGEKLNNVAGALDVLKQVTCEAVVHWPWLYIPAYYVVKQTISPTGFSLSSIANNLRSNWREDLMLIWKVWIPAALINFSSVPLDFQIPFVAFISMFYIALFSLKRGGETSSKDDKMK